MGARIVTCTDVVVFGLAASEFNGLETMIPILISNIRNAI